MGDMIKGLLRLILLIVASAVAYASWLVLTPVTESDAEFRVSNVCYGGQFINSALNGASQRQFSCDCVVDGLVAGVGRSAMAKGADALRQTIVTQMWSALQGEGPAEPDKALMADRDVLTFVATLHRLDTSCAVSPFAAAR